MTNCTRKTHMQTVKPYQNATGIYEKKWSGHHMQDVHEKQWWYKREDVIDGVKFSVTLEALFADDTTVLTY